MSKFYLLPPRPTLACVLARTLKPLFPGLSAQDPAWGQAVECLTEALSRGNEVFLVHREELPEGVDTLKALADGFGAEIGDEVVEVGTGTERL